MAAVPTEFEHPLAQCARAIGGALDEVAGIDPTYLPPSAKGDVLVELARVAERTKALMLRVLTCSDDLAAAEGARTAAAWLAHHTHRDRGPTTADLRLGEALESRWTRTRDAVGSGAVNLDQARVVTAALDALPEGLDPDLVTRAEEHLVDQSAGFAPAELRVLGRRVLDVIAPELGEAHERAALEAEERHAREHTTLTFRRRGDGTTDLHARLPDPVAARLRTYLEAHASPRRERLDPTRSHTDPATGQRLPYSRLLGQAFCALLEAVPASSLPLHGGSATTVVVTLDHDTLLTRLGTAGLTSGETITAAEAMRLACTADVVPLVLGGSGQPLHLGRARRLFSRSQRLAMAVRDGQCRAEGCDIPAAWCEAHHADDPWSRGGRTDIEDGALLCSWHHHRAHDPGFTTARLPNGDFRYHRRT